MGADLDPELEQEIADLDDLDEEEHPDYYHIDTDQVDDKSGGEADPRKVFKTIALPTKDAQVTHLKISQIYWENFFYFTPTSNLTHYDMFFIVKTLNTNYSKLDIILHFI